MHMGVQEEKGKKQEKEKKESDLKFLIKTIFLVICVCVS